MSYYTYWSGLPMDGRFETAVRPGRGFAAWPTHDDLTLVIAGRPIDEFEAVRQDVEGSYLKALEIAPAFAERMRAAKREERFARHGGPGYFRKPFGPGWALVGDAGYNKDFITAQGIHDAFRDAELCAAALDAWLAGERSFEDAHAGVPGAPRRARSCRCTSSPPTSRCSRRSPPELQQVLSAVSGSQEAMDGFARVIGGVTSPAEFFSDENVGRILAVAS